MKISTTILDSFKKSILDSFDFLKESVFFSKFLYCFNLLLGESFLPFKYLLSNKPGICSGVQTFKSGIKYNA